MVNSTVNIARCTKGARTLKGLGDPWVSFPTQAQQGCHQHSRHLSHCPDGAHLEGLKEPGHPWVYSPLDPKQTRQVLVILALERLRQRVGRLRPAHGFCRENKPLLSESMVPFVLSLFVKLWVSQFWARSCGLPKPAKETLVTVFSFEDVALLRNCLQ